MRCETICGVHKALKLFLINLTFLMLHSLTKLLPCRSLDMFHKESKCSKQRGPSVNLKFRSKTLQLENKGSAMCSWCHLFFASMSTNREALIYNLANGGKERKGRTREYVTQSLSFPSTEQEPITAPDRAVA